MDFFLTYQGRVKSSKDVQMTNDFRKSFSKQLMRMKDDPRLTDWIEELSNPKDEIKGARNFNSIDFVPFFGISSRTTVELQITMLSGLAAKSPINSGDLDNRMKRIIDGLRCPQQQNEVPVDSIFENNRCFCLMSDDSILTNLRMEIYPNLSSKTEHETFVMIKIKVRAISLTWQNSAFGI